MLIPVPGELDLSSTVQIVLEFYYPDFLWQAGVGAAIEIIWATRPYGEG